jgi:hypothetical protein
LEKRLKASEAYKRGLFNMAGFSVDAETGVVTVTFKRSGERQTHTFKVKRLYEEDELVVSDEEVTVESDVGSGEQKPQ